MHVEAEGRERSREGGRTSCPLGRRLHSTGDLRRVLIKVMVELISKGRLLTSKKPLALETVALGQAIRADLERSRWNEQDSHQDFYHQQKIGKHRKSPGWRGLGTTVLLISPCVTNYLKQP